MAELRLSGHRLGLLHGKFLEPQIMSTGHKIKLGKGAKIKDGKIITVHHFRDASHAIRAKNSKRVRVSRRTTP